MPEHGATPQIEDGKSLRVLLVDDSTDALRSLARLLGMLGCVVLDSDKPQECIAKARHFRPELVLLDLSMPGIDGFSLARQLRELDLPPFYLAAVTGHGDAETRARCEEQGFDYFLLKPTSVAEIEHVLGLARNRRAQV